MDAYWHIPATETPQPESSLTVGEIFDVLDQMDECEQVVERADGAGT